MIPADGESATVAQPGLPRAPASAGEALGWVALLGAMAAWGGWFIYRTSFVFTTGRVFCLFDDAMISMAYARNLVEGYGLNWARFGPPVEGFTHPLWTALLVPVNLLPISLERRSLVVQVGSLALLMLHLVLVRRLMLRHFTLPGACHWAPACVLTAFYYPLDYWSLMGMETGLQAVLTTASVLLALDIVHGRRDRHLALLQVGTLAVLLRLDMAPLVLAVQIYVLAHGGLRLDGGGDHATRRGEAGKHWFAGVAMLVTAVVGYGVFRWVYFHDLLPNTYYLKLGGVPLLVRLLRGGSVMLDTLRGHGPLLLVVAIGVAALRLRRGPPGWSGRWEHGSDRYGDREWSDRLLLPVALFGICCAYSVYVGGDAWEGDRVGANRFVAFAMPQVFVVFNALLNRSLSALAVAGWKRRHSARISHPHHGTAGSSGVPTGEPLLPRLGLLVATAAALLAANGLLAPATEAAGTWRKFLSLSRPPYVKAHEEILVRARELQRIADPSAVVAVVWAGIPAYFTNFRMVDQLGYNDRHIAHGKPAEGLTEDRFQDFLPGHVKGDVAYVLDVRRPDAIFQEGDLAKAHPGLRERGYRRLGSLWILPASPRIHLTPRDRSAMAAMTATDAPGARAAPGGGPPR